MINALNEYGAPPQVGIDLLSAEADQIVWFGRPPNRIDLIQTLPGLDFIGANQRAVFAESGGQQIPVIGIDDLILNKEAVGRDQDKLDAKVLRRNLRK